MGIVEATPCPGPLLEPSFSVSCLQWGEQAVPSHSVLSVCSAQAYRAELSKTTSQNKPLLPYLVLARGLATAIKAVMKTGSSSPARCPFPEAPTSLPSSTNRGKTSPMMLGWDQPYGGPGALWQDFRGTWTAVSCFLWS